MLLLMPWLSIDVVLCGMEYIHSVCANVHRCGMWLMDAVWEKNSNDIVIEGVFPCT